VTSDPASQASNRFEVVFNNISSPVAVSFTGITATAQGSGVSVNWSVTGETAIKDYVVERSVDGVHFSAIGTVGAKGNSGSAESYSWQDASASGTVYYRVEAQGVSGSVSYTGIVEVTVGSAQPQIAVYPNPSSDGHLTLVLTNEPSGTYGLKLLSASGQAVYSTSLSHGSGNEGQSLAVPSNLAAGIYQLEIITPSHGTQVEQLIIK